MHITVKCPYCESENFIPLSPGYHFSKIVTCDLDGGGCDADYVIKIATKHIVQSFTLVEKINLDTP